MSLLDIQDDHECESHSGCYEVHPRDRFARRIQAISVETLYETVLTRLDSSSGNPVSVIKLNLCQGPFLTSSPTGNKYPIMVSRALQLRHGIRYWSCLLQFRIDAVPGNALACGYPGGSGKAVPLRQYPLSVFLHLSHSDRADHD